MAIQNIPPALPQMAARQSSGTSEAQKVSAPAAPDPVQRAAAAAEAAELQQSMLPAKASPGREQIDRAMSEVRKALDPVARNLQFSIDEETGRTVIKVVDSTTQQVIRQMPSEELLALTRSLDSLSGLFVKQKA